MTVLFFAKEVYHMKKRSVKTRLLLTGILLSLLLPTVGCNNRKTPDTTSFTVPDNSFVAESFLVPQTSESSTDTPSSEPTSAETSEPSMESHEPSDNTSEVSLPSEPSSQDSSSVSFDASDSRTEPSESRHTDESSREASVQQPYDPLEDASDIEELDNKYFVNELDADALRHFARLYHGAASFAEKVTFSEDIPSELLDDLMFLLNYDCPELIQINGDYMPYYSDDYGSTVSGVRFTYTMNQDEYQQAQQALDTFRQQLVEDTSYMNPDEKEMYVYRLLFDRVIFDDYRKHAGSIYGALIENHARCEGISKAFAWCLQQCGMECLTLAGTPLWENTGAYAGHSWNIVKLEDNWYHVDVTADNLKISEDEATVPLYGFLNSSDAQMERTHRINEIFLRLGVPSCPSEQMNYHVTRGQYIDSGDDLQNRFDSILHNRYIEGEDAQISIRLDTEETFHTLIDHWEEWWEDFRIAQDYLPCDSSMLLNDVALTVVIQLRSYTTD